MAAPAFRAAAHGNTTNNATCTVNAPAGLAQNDCLIAWVSGGFIDAETLALPTGWAFISPYTGAGLAGASGGRFWLAYKIAGAGEPATYTFTVTTASGTHSWQAIVAAYSGADTTGPIDVSDGITAAAGNSVTSPSVTTTGQDRTAVVCFGEDGAGTTVDSWTTPSGFTSRDTFQETGTYVFAGLFDKTVASPAAVSGTSTKSANDATNNGRLSGAAIVALKPPGASTTGGATFGRSTVGSATDSAGAGHKQVHSVTALAGTAAKMTAYYDGAPVGVSGVLATDTQPVRGVIYADSAGAAGALLGETDEVVIQAGQAAGWVDLPFSTPPTTTAATVWVGFIYGPSPAGRQIARIYCDGTGGDKYNDTDTYPSASDPFGTASTTAGHSNPSLFVTMANAPAYRSEAHASASAATSISPSKPTGTAAGDGLLAFVYAQAATTITPPAGWSQIPGSVSDGGGTLFCFTRLADGSEGASFAFTADVSGNLWAAVVCYQAVAAFGNYAGKTGSGNSASTNTVTTTGSPRTVVSAFVKNGADGVADSWASTGANERLDYQATTAGYLFGAVYDELQNVAGGGSISRAASCAAGNASNGSTGWSSFIISLQASAPAGAPQNTALPTVTGTAQVAATLSSSDGTWSPVVGSGTTITGRQWQRAPSPGGTVANISGATGATYTLQAADQGQVVRVAVTGSNTSGATTAYSAWTATVAAAPATGGTTPPVIAGTPAAGSTLTVTSTGTWPFTPSTFTYQWQRSADGATGWANIGSGAATYMITAGDVSYYIRCLVTAYA